MIPAFFRLRQLPTTASTNADVKAAAAAGEPEGLVIQSRIQTSGQGRQGRQWDSPEGNIYASVLLRPNCSLQEAGCYSFVGALAIHDTARNFLPDADIQLKWPNDVLISNKKVSGILLESGSANGAQVDWLVVGMGVNVNYHPDQSAYPTTSLAANLLANLTLTVEEALPALLQNFADRRQQLLDKGFESIRKDWLSLAKTGPVTARLPHETVEGTFLGLNSQGSLILRLADGKERAIAAGDIFFPSKDDGHAAGDRRREHEHGLRPL